MKESVIVNGISLTRAQIEAALKDLNAPEAYVPKPGDLFRVAYKGPGNVSYTGQTFLALSHEFTFNNAISLYKPSGVLAAPCNRGEGSFDFQAAQFNFFKVILL